VNGKVLLTWQDEGVEDIIAALDRSTFQVEPTAWSKDLAVEVAGHGVVSHAGSAAVRLLADRTGLTEALSRALARRGFFPVHDRGLLAVSSGFGPAWRVDGGKIVSLTA